MCGAHLQTYSDKDIKRIMYLCPDIAKYPGAKLLSLIWEVRMCEHLKAPQRLLRSGHPRLQKVWSKLQLTTLLHPDFDLVLVIDTDTMAVQSMNELFWHQAPGAVWRGANTHSGRKRDERSYGTPDGSGGARPLGDIDGGLAFFPAESH